MEVAVTGDRAELWFFRVFQARCQCIVTRALIGRRPVVKVTPLGFRLLSITEGKTDLSVSRVECLVAKVLV